MNQETKKSIFIFIAGGFFFLVFYLLIIKPADKDVPTIFDQERQNEIQENAEKKVEQSRTNQKKISEDFIKQKQKNDEVFRDGLTATEYDSITRAIREESRTADSLRNAAGL